jgi:hypothetical protein
VTQVAVLKAEANEAAAAAAAEAAMVKEQVEQAAASAAAELGAIKVEAEAAAATATVQIAAGTKAAADAVEAAADYAALELAAVQEAAEADMETRMSLHHNLESRACCWMLRAALLHLRDAVQKARIAKAAVDLDAANKVAAAVSGELEAMRVAAQAHREHQAALAVSRMAGRAGRADVAGRFHRWAATALQARANRLYLAHCARRRSTRACRAVLEAWLQYYPDRLSNLSLSLYNYDSPPPEERLVQREWGLEEQDREQQRADVERQLELPSVESKLEPDVQAAVLQIIVGGAFLAGVGPQSPQLKAARVLNRGDVLLGEGDERLAAAQLQMPGHNAVRAQAAAAVAAPAAMIDEAELEVSHAASHVEYELEDAIFSGHAALATAELATAELAAAAVAAAAAAAAAEEADAGVAHAEAAQANWIGSLEQQLQVRVAEVEMLQTKYAEHATAAAEWAADRMQLERQLAQLTQDEVVEWAQTPKKRLVRSSADAVAAELGEQIVSLKAELGQARLESVDTNRRQQSAAVIQAGFRRSGLARQLRTVVTAHHTRLQEVTGGHQKDRDSLIASHVATLSVLSATQQEAVRAAEAKLAEAGRRQHAASTIQSKFRRIGARRQLESLAAQHQTQVHAMLAETEAIVEEAEVKSKEQHANMMDILCDEEKKAAAQLAARLAEAAARQHAAATIQAAHRQGCARLELRAMVSIVRRAMVSIVLRCGGHITLDCNGCIGEDGGSSIPFAGTGGASKTCRGGGGRPCGHGASAPCVAPRGAAVLLTRTMAVHAQVKLLRETEAQAALQYGTKLAAAAVTQHAAAKIQAAYRRRASRRQLSQMVSAAWRWGSARVVEADSAAAEAAEAAAAEARRLALAARAEAAEDVRATLEAHAATVMQMEAQHAAALLATADVQQAASTIQAARRRQAARRVARSVVMAHHVRMGAAAAAAAEMAEEVEQAAAIEMERGLHAAQLAAAADIEAQLQSAHVYAQQHAAAAIQAERRRVVAGRQLQAVREAHAVELAAHGAEISRQQCAAAMIQAAQRRRGSQREMRMMLAAHHEWLRHLEADTEVAATGAAAEREAALEAAIRVAAVESAQEAERLRTEYEEWRLQSRQAAEAERIAAAGALKDARNQAAADLQAVSERAAAEAAMEQESQEASRHAVAYLAAASERLAAVEQHAAAVIQAAFRRWVVLKVGRAMIVAHGERLGEAVVRADRRLKTELAVAAVAQYAAAAIQAAERRRASRRQLSQMLSAHGARVVELETAAHDTAEQNLRVQYEREAIIEQGTTEATRSVASANTIQRRQRRRQEAAATRAVAAVYRNLVAEGRGVADALRGEVAAHTAAAAIVAVAIAVQEAAAQQVPGLLATARREAADVAAGALDRLVGRRAVELLWERWCKTRSRRAVVAQALLARCAARQRAHRQRRCLLAWHGWLVHHREVRHSWPRELVRLRRASPRSDAYTRATEPELGASQRVPRGSESLVALGRNAAGPHRTLVGNFGLHTSMSDLCCVE